MKVVSKYESALVLENIEIIEAVFRKKQDYIEDIELGININREIAEIENSKYDVTVETTVADEEQNIYVNVVCKASFQTSQENQILIEKNTVAIMFPYIRSYITSITTQPGMTPIVLPAINVNALINDKR